MSGSSLGLTSSEGIIAQLDEAHPDIILSAITRLDLFVNSFWHEISDHLLKLERIYESTSLPDDTRCRAALVISKVYFHLGEYSQSMDFAILAGNKFSIKDNTEYISTVTSCLLDRYILLRRNGTFECEIDPPFHQLINQIFDHSLEKGNHKAVIGTAFDSHRIDIFVRALEKSGYNKKLLSYSLRLCIKFVSQRELRDNILKIIVAHEPAFHDMFQCLVLLEDSDKAAAEISRLYNSDNEDSILMAYQSAFDLRQDAPQNFTLKLTTTLSQSISQVDLSPLLSILNGQVPVAHHLNFLETKNKSDPVILQESMVFASYKPVLTTAVIVSNAFMHAGTTSEVFLRCQREKLTRSCRNWAKYTAVASFGVIHRGNEKKAKEILAKYFPQLNVPRNQNNGDAGDQAMQMEEDSREITESGNAGEIDESGDARDINNSGDDEDAEITESDNQESADVEEEEDDNQESADIEEEEDDNQESADIEEEEDDNQESADIEEEEDDNQESADIEEEEDHNQESADIEEEEDELFEIDDLSSDDEFDLDEEDENYDLFQSDNGGFIEGGALYALGLIQANRSSSSVINIFLEQIRSPVNSTTCRGACLGLGLAAMSLGADNPLIVLALQQQLNADDAVVGDAAAIALGLVALGTFHEKLIEEMIEFSLKTEHEKIQRGIAVGLSLICFGHMEKADKTADRLVGYKDNGLLRRAGAMAIGMAYCGTCNDEAVKKLLKIGTTDNDHDVRRAAIISVGFVMAGNPDESVEFLQMFEDSYNPHTRYAVAIALGISCAGSGNIDALNILTNLAKDREDIVRQGAFIASSMILIQQTEAINPKVKEFNKLYEDTIRSPFEGEMGKFGAILAQGIMNAGGRNVTISLKTRTGHLWAQGAVGIFLFTQYWYWFPLSLSLCISFTPTCVIGVDKYLKVPEMEFISNCPASMFEYPKPHAKRDLRLHGQISKRVDDVLLSFSLREIEKKLKNLNDTITDIIREVKNTTKEEKKDAPAPEPAETPSTILKNPTRVLKQQLKFLICKLNEKYEPVMPEALLRGGFVLLKDKTPNAEVPEPECNDGIQDEFDDEKEDEFDDEKDDEFDDENEVDEKADEFDDEKEEFDDEKEEFDDEKEGEFDDEEQDEIDDVIQDEFDDGMQDEFDNGMQNEFDDEEQDEFDDEEQDEFDDEEQDEFDDEEQDEFDDEEQADEFDDEEQDEFDDEEQDEFDDEEQDEFDDEAQDEFDDGMQDDEFDNEEQDDFDDEEQDDFDDEDQDDFDDEDQDEFDDGIQDEFDDEQEVESEEDSENENKEMSTAIIKVNLCTMQ